MWLHLDYCTQAVAPLLQSGCKRKLQRTKVVTNSLLSRVKLQGKYLSAKCGLSIDNEKENLKSLQISHINNENVFVSFSKKV